jgi:hypothetical protein
MKSVDVPGAGRGKSMRIILGVLLLSATPLVAAAAPPEQHWCAISNEGASNCSFASLAQCRVNVLGTGGNCIPEAPVGHRQPGTARTASAPDADLDALIDRVNKRTEKLILCKGC